MSLLSLSFIGSKLPWKGYLYEILPGAGIRKSKYNDVIDELRSEDGSTAIIRNKEMITDSYSLREVKSEFKILPKEVSLGNIEEYMLDVKGNLWTKEDKESKWRKMFPEMKFEHMRFGDNGILISKQRLYLSMMEYDSDTDGNDVEDSGRHILHSILPEVRFDLILDPNILIDNEGYIWNFSWNISSVDEFEEKLVKTSHKYFSPRLISDEKISDDHNPWEPEIYEKLKQITDVIDVIYPQHSNIADVLTNKYYYHFDLDLDQNGEFIEMKYEIRLAKERPSRWKWHSHRSIKHNFARFTQSGNLITRFPIDEHPVVTFY